MSLVFFLIVIVIVVFFHELGHFIAARMCKMRVSEFSIGFGPEIFSYKDKSNVNWKLCLVPLGGYVRILSLRVIRLMGGTPTQDEIDNAFESKSLFKRFFVVFMGPLFSVFLGFLMFFVVYSFQGIPLKRDYNKTGIGDVVKQSPADFASLSNGDVIKNIVVKNGEKIKINNFYDLYMTVNKHGSDKMIFEVLKKKSSVVENVEINAVEKIVKGEIKYQVGIYPAKNQFENIGIVESFIKSFNKTIVSVGIVVVAVKDLIVGNIGIDSLAGPVKIAQISSDAAGMGIFTFLMFVGLMSINLGVFNMLPIPILDGGQILLMLIEKIKGKNLDDNTYSKIFMFGFLFMFLIFVFVLFYDLS